MRVEINLTANFRLEDVAEGWTEAELVALGRNKLEALEAAEARILNGFGVEPMDEPDVDVTVVEVYE